MSTPDEIAIMGLVDTFQDAWNRHDLRALVDLFTEDADLIIRTGLRRRGRPEIEANMVTIHGGMFKRSHWTNTGASIRFLHPEIALVHSTRELDGVVDQYDQLQPPINSRVTYVVTKANGSWSISCFQNTDIIAPPANMTSSGQDAT